MKRRKLIPTSVTLPEELMMEVIKYCERNRLTRTEAIRELISKGLNSQ